MVNVDRAAKIDGWMLETELLWLAGAAQRHKVLVEIGSYKGRSTRALADNTDGLVIAVDDFYGPREIELAGRDTIYDQFLSNTSDLPNVAVIRANHRELPEPEFTPDFVFIDGAHEYEAVKADIQYWLPRIAAGGLLAGHDYTWFDGVRTAVQELLPGAQVAPGTSIWFYEIPLEVPHATR